MLFYFSSQDVLAVEFSENIDNDEGVNLSATIPLMINLTPQNVTKHGVTRHKIEPRINWFDGVSNSFSVRYENAYGITQINRTFYSYNVTAPSTTYVIDSGSTRFSGRHKASVSTPLSGSDVASGTITLYRH